MSIHINVGDRVIATSKTDGRLYDVLVSAVTPAFVKGLFLTNNWSKRSEGLFLLEDFTWRYFEEPKPEPAIPTQDADNLITAAALVGKDVLVKVNIDKRIVAFGNVLAVNYGRPQGSSRRVPWVTVQIKGGAEYNLRTYYLEEVNDG